MSTSGSTDFNLNASQIIEEAFDICGIGSEGEAISSDMTTRAQRSLNLILKTWGTKSHLWVNTERSLTLVDSTASYALTPKPMRVPSVRRRLTNGTIDTPLTEMSRQQYFDSPNKAAMGPPTQFYYDPQVSTGTIYLWPTPDATTASNFTLELTYLRRIEDIDSTTDDADLPQEWLQALSYALASELALKYGVAPDVRAEINARAAALSAQLESFDTEPASLFMQPDNGWC
jgi:hypothetical protein